MDNLSIILLISNIFLVISVIYLMYAVNDLSRKNEDSLEKQRKYFSDRLSTVEQASSDHTKQIKQNQKDLEELNNNLKDLTGYASYLYDFESEQATKEIKIIAEAISNIAQVQDISMSCIANNCDLIKEADSKLASQLKEQIKKNLSKDIPEAIHSRNLNNYQVRVGNLPRAENLVKELKNTGYAARVYEYQTENEPTPEDYKMIWVGSNIPAKVAIEIMQIAVKHLPSLKYVKLTSDGVHEMPNFSHSEIFIAAPTNTAVGENLHKWTVDDFNQMNPDMSPEEFHKYIRNYYNN